METLRQGFVPLPSPLCHLFIPCSTSVDNFWLLFSLDRQTGDRASRRAGMCFDISNSTTRAVRWRRPGRTEEVLVTWQNPLARPWCQQRVCSWVSAADCHEQALPDAGSGPAGLSPPPPVFVMVEVMMAVAIKARDLHGLPVLVFALWGKTLGVAPSRCEAMGGPSFLGEWWCFTSSS